MFIFVIVRSFHRPSLCNWPRTSVNAGSTAETQFWETRLLQSATFRKFQEYPGNPAIVKKTRFHSWKQEEITNSQIKCVEEWGRGKARFSGQNLLLLLFVGEHPRHKLRGDSLHVQIPPPRIRRSTLRAISEIVLRRPSLKILWTFSTFSSVRPEPSHL